MCRRINCVCVRAQYTKDKGRKGWRKDMETQKNLQYWKNARDKDRKRSDVMLGREGCVCNLRAKGQAALCVCVCLDSPGL